MTRLVLATDLTRVLAERGLIPTNTRRVVLDLKAGEPGVVYFELLTDELWLDVFQNTELEIKGKQ